MAESRVQRTEFMQWKMEKAQTVGPGAGRAFSAVPLIPSDLSEGSQSRSVVESAVIQRALNNPLVPLGMLATVGCLIGMSRAIFNRNQMQAQKFMRGRCAAQGFTIFALVAGALVYSSSAKKETTSPASTPQ